MEKDKRYTAWTSLVLLEEFRLGSELAAESLFSRYFERLTALARSRLSSRLARRTDPEDIVMSVYRSFFAGARAGRFTLTRGGDLWRLLSAITKHKLCRQIRHDMADRRSVEIEESIDQIEEVRILERGDAPSPEEAVALSDELEWIFGQLETSGRRILELRLQGRSSPRSRRPPAARNAPFGAPSRRSAISWLGDETIRAHCSRIKTSCCSG